MTEEMKRSAADRLLSLLEKATCPYTASAALKIRLAESGFQELNYQDNWTIERGKSYYVSPFDTTIIAFRVGTDQKRPTFRIASSHIDSPCLRVKCGQVLSDNAYKKINVEPYGGGIWNTWLDRPLSMAGSVCIKGDSVFTPKRMTVDFEKPVCVVPNRAFHLNRSVNDGVPMKAQTDLIPIGGTGAFCEGSLLEMLAKKLEISADEILSYELYLYNAEKGCVVGFDDSMITAPRIDNLSSASALLEGILAGGSGEIDVACFYDHEEIGNESKNGAAGELLPYVLERVTASLGYERTDYLEALAGGIYLSLDVAHANHPNHPEVTDPTTGMALNEGVAIKTAGKQCYSTDSFAAGVVTGLCRAHEIPCRINYPNSNSVGGGTVGPVITSKLVLESADIGMPILAMHSSMETAGVCDYAYLEQLMTAFYQD